MKPDYILGLDLGQAADFTALTILERPPRPKDCDGDFKPVYSVRHLQRFPLGIPYTTIVPQIAEMLEDKDLGHPPLVTDQTGVGRALVDMLKRAGMKARVVPVTITAGHAVTHLEDFSWHVPKKELVTCLQILLQFRRLRVAKTLPDADILVKEMEGFKVKITESSNEVFGTWREGRHDDLVLAVALACWYAERHPPWSAKDIRSGRRSTKGAVVW